MDRRAVSTRTNARDLSSLLQGGSADIVLPGLSRTLRHHDWLGGILPQPAPLDLLFFPPVSA